VPKAQIAKRLGISRNTVAKAIAWEAPPRYERAPQASTFAAVEVQVRQLLVEVPSMPATVLAERVGWTGSSSWFREQVAKIRPEYAPADPADRIVYCAGDQAQCDLWFTPAVVPDTCGAPGPPVLVMVASFSRFVTATMLPTRTTADFLSGAWSLLANQLGAVPRRLVWDNEAGIGRRNHLAAGVTAFTGALATNIVQLKPFDPESKGMVERASQYLETSFLPGRRFCSPQDFNTQLTHWLPSANERTVRVLKARPVDLVDQDRDAMLALPPPAGFAHRIRLGRDYYVRVLSNDYSVDPVAIGRMVDIRADSPRRRSC
jgi:transposase